MDLVGKILAERYEIREEIGKGGMAHVYKAWCKMLNRFVAIKALKEEYKDDIKLDIDEIDFPSNNEEPEEESDWEEESEFDDEDELDDFDDEDIDFEDEGGEF